MIQHGQTRVRRQAEAHDSGGGSGESERRPNLLRDAAGQPRHVRVAIIGSGFGGLCMAIKLRQAGIEDFVILERADAVGGTWRDNTYPGCQCDVPSHLYSYSFEPEREWTAPYAGHAEIRAYIERVTDKYGIRPFVQFGASLKEARFDEQAAVWRGQTADGERFSADILVSATGGLSNPLIPELEGRETFEGPQFHSARWDHDVDLKGKRVAIVGSGASTVQFLPHVARDAAQVTLFQRTPPWVMPKRDAPFSPRARWLLRHVAPARWLLRLQLFLAHEAVGFAFRRPNIMDGARRAGKRHIRQYVSDPELRRKLTPSYTPGCKRILLSNEYYPALARDNVDVETSGIAEIREHSIVTKDGREVPTDVIIYGTGFDVHGMSMRHHIVGRDGAVLGDGGKDAYLGAMFAGFPNFFMLGGPNAGLGHNSVIIILEGAVRLAMNGMRMLDKHGKRTIEVKREASVRYNERVQEKLAGSVWNSGCASWYLDENGRNTTIWPGSAASYARATRKLPLQDVELG
jgi:cation diffusion facilitator CzcD-associated flavoprotein CzcO